MSLPDVIIKPGEVLHDISPLNLHDERIAKAAEANAKYLKEHKGHEQAHFYMILLMFFIVFGFQVMVITWKKRHYPSYQLVSLFGIWLFPAIISLLYIHNKTFFSIWSLFSILNGWVISRASQTPLHHLTPRLIYKWFSITHHISFVVGVIGYVSMMTLMFIFPVPDPDDGDVALSLPIVFLLYGLYFGLLSRDFAELCSDRMAATLGYHVKSGLPNKQLRDNVCAICGGFLIESRHSETQEQQEPIHTIDCTHTFHEKCLRGWCIVGKKDTCPYCHEKVSLKKLSRNPWDTQQELYLNLLDYIRYLIVWVPVMCLVTIGSYKLFNLD